MRGRLIGFLVFDHVPRSRVGFPFVVFDHVPRSRVGFPFVVFDHVPRSRVGFPFVVFDHVPRSRVGFPFVVFDHVPRSRVGFPFVVFDHVPRSRVGFPFVVFDHVPRSRVGFPFVVLDHVPRSRVGFPFVVFDHVPRSRVGFPFVVLDHVPRSRVGFPFVVFDQCPSLTRVFLLRIQLTCIYKAGKTMWTLLFDIDGTLIRSRGAGMAASARAMDELFGISELPELEVHGRTDHGIFSDLFARCGMDPNEQIPARTVRTLPGLHWNLRGKMLGTGLNLKKSGLLATQLLISPARDRSIRKSLLLRRERVATTTCSRQTLMCRWSSFRIRLS